MVGRRKVIGDGMVRKATHVKQGDLHGVMTVFIPERDEEPAMQESERP